MIFIVSSRPAPLAILTYISVGEHRTLARLARPSHLVSFSPVAAMKRYAPLALYLALATLTTIATSSPAQSADRAALTNAAASITKDELKNYIDVLADDTLEGRETGSRGGRAASNYLLKAFEKLGAAPAGDNGTYFQSFNAASRNVVGIVEGSDPRLKDQAIVIGAHYDHVGYGTSRNSFGPLGYLDRKSVV